MINLELENSARPSEAPANDQPPNDPHSLPHEKWDEDLLERKKHEALFSGWQGRLVMIFGVILPALLITAFGGICFDRVCMLMIKHPLETFIECALMLSVPLGNLSIWSVICKKDTRFAMRRGIVNGIAFGAALIVCGVCIAALTMGRAVILSGSQVITFTQGFLVISVIFAASLAVSVYLAFRLRAMREFHSARLRTLIYSSVGVILAFLGFTGSEAKSMYMRIAEHMTFAGATHDEQQKGLAMLRGMNPELDMRLECADPRTVGLAGLFIPISNSTEQQLYFAAVGKPFRDDRSNDLSVFSNDYLHRHVVGESIPELSLRRSGLDGIVNPQTLSTTLNWTFVFKNVAYEDKEARAEMELPPGAVITDVTLWQDGLAQKAVFAPSGKAPQLTTWQDVGHSTPAVVSDLGRGRILLHCYPVKAQDEMKVRLTFVMPLKLDSETEAALTLPRFLDTNFQVQGEHHMRLRSPERLALKLDGVKESTSPTGENVLSGELKNGELSNISLTVTAIRKPSSGTTAFADPLVPGRYVLQTIARTPIKIPNHLIVVLDGSQSVKRELADIKNALTKLPGNVISSIVVASDFRPNLVEPAPIKSINVLTENDFDGGQDNLQAVVKAASTAGETKNGAVLWIHGPQPTLNKELYVMAPYTQTPDFYEMALDNSVTDANEFFKNHREIGPFNAVPRNGSVGHDLQRFVSRWTPEGVEFVVRNEVKYGGSKQPPTRNPAQALEIASLTAGEECQNKIDVADYNRAMQIATQHHLVTPVSSAIVIDRAVGGIASGLGGGSPVVAPIAIPMPEIAPSKAAPEIAASSDATSTMEPPSLQGATNGTIAASLSSDATYVTGVNTAGTVRVNNLANLEALLNIVANGCEILGLLCGLTLIVTASVNLSLAQKLVGTKMLGRNSIIAISIAMIVGGLCVPGSINWLVASARDANLFS